MWFNQDDQRRGSIGDERLREIIAEIVLKVDPQKTNQQALEQQSSDLIASIEKHFKYKKQERLDPASNRDHPEMIKMQNQINFFNGCHLANLELLQFEGMLLQQKEEAIKRELQDHQHKIEGIKEKAALLDANTQMILDNIRQRELDLLLQQKEYHEKMLADLMSYQKSLDDQLKFLALDVLQSRHQTAATVKDELKAIPQLANLNDQQMDKLTNGLVLLEEAKALQLNDIDEKIARARERDGERKGSNLGQGLHFSKPKAESIEILRLEAERSRVISEYNDKKQSLYEAVGIPLKDIPVIDAEITENSVIREALENNAQKVVKSKKEMVRIKAEQQSVAIEIDKEKNEIAKADELSSELEALKQIYGNSTQKAAVSDIDITEINSVSGEVNHNTDTPDQNIMFELDISGFELAEEMGMGDSELMFDLILDEPEAVFLENIESLDVDGDDIPFTPNASGEPSQSKGYR